MTIVTIMQPAYLPWLGFFDRAQLADVLVVMDHVTIDKNTSTQFSNRNRVKLTNGKPAWLTVPIKSRGEFADAPICGLPLADDPRWRRKHLQTLQAAYAKAPFFKEHFPVIQDIIESDASNLVEVTEPLNRHLFDVLGIDTKVIYSSDLEPRSRKSELVLELCQIAGASGYVSGPFGRDYLDVDAFSTAGIDVFFHDYVHPTYRQMHGDFLSHLSIVDLLFNEGEAARGILSSNPGDLATS